MSFALILASISFLMVVFWGRPFLALLRHWQIGKRIRIDGPDRHFTKLGTPTMGGILITVPVVDHCSFEYLQSPGPDRHRALHFGAAGCDDRLCDTGRPG